MTISLEKGDNMKALYVIFGSEEVEQFEDIAAEDRAPTDDELENIEIVKLPYSSDKDKQSLIQALSHNYDDYSTYVLVDKSLYIRWRRLMGH